MKFVLCVVALSLAFTSTACGSEDAEEVKGFPALEHHIANNRIGHDADSWIEMKNMAGEWERTGLIFGYLGDYDECQNAIAGLKATNYERDYRCVPAN